MGERLTSRSYEPVLKKERKNERLTKKIHGSSNAPKLLGSREPEVYRDNTSSQRSWIIVNHEPFIWVGSEPLVSGSEPLLQKSRFTHP